MVDGANLGARVYLPKLGDSRFLASFRDCRILCSKETEMLGNASRIAVLCSGITFLASAADAHDSWINKGGYR
jgi:hypothetical protein